MVVVVGGVVMGLGRLCFGPWGMRPCRRSDGADDHHNNTISNEPDHHQAPNRSGAGASLGQRSSEAVLGRSPRPSGFAGRCSPNGN